MKKDLSKKNIQTKKNTKKQIKRKREKESEKERERERKKERKKERKRERERERKKEERKKKERERVFNVFLNPPSSSSTTFNGLFVFSKKKSHPAIKTSNLFLLIPNHHLC